MKNGILFIYLFISFIALYGPIKNKSERIKGFTVEVAVIDVNMPDAVNGNDYEYSERELLHGAQVVKTILDINPCVNITKYNYEPDSLKSFEDALEVAIYKRPHIINISSSGAVKSDREKELFEKASKLGIVIVVSAGNDGQEINNNFKPYPMSYKSDSMISVGALDFKNNIASFSNYGDSVDIYAEGRVNVRINGVTYPFTGTSAAAAVVTARLSRIISPFITPIQARDRYLEKSNSRVINRRIASLRGD